MIICPHVARQFPPLPTGHHSYFLILGTFQGTRRQQSWRADHVVHISCPEWEGKGTPQGQLEVPPAPTLGAWGLALNRWGLRMDVESGHSVVWADAECGTHECRFTKAIEKGLG